MIEVLNWFAADGIRVVALLVLAVILASGLRRR